MLHVEGSKVRTRRPGLLTKPKRRKRKMISISINVDDTKKQEVIDSFCWGFGYDNNKLENETKAQFALRTGKDQFKEMVKGMVRNHRRYLLDTDAKEQAIEDDVETNLDEAIT